MATSPIASSRQSKVIVIGAGLSGLTAAYRVRQAGIDLVIVLEARDRVGGRIDSRVTTDGRLLHVGAEYFVGHGEPLLDLARELDVGFVDSAAEMGKTIRYSDNRTIVEDYPFALDPEAGEEVAATIAVLDELSQQVPPAQPWAAPLAAEWDAQTIGAWLLENVSSSAARTAFDALAEFTARSNHSTSLLYVLWLLRTGGGWGALTSGDIRQFEGGPSAFIERLVSRIGSDRIVLKSPVQNVAHSEAGVAVTTPTGVYRADVLIVAIGPQLCTRISWEPQLPPDRRRLNELHTGGNFIKVLARYESPWWRDSGLMGYAVGPKPVSMISDATIVGEKDATLGAMIAVTEDVQENFSESLTHDAGIAGLFDDAVSAYFGPGTPAPTGIDISSWIDSDWTPQSATGLPPGVLTTVGYTLRKPVGRILWAGAESGQPQIEGMPAAVGAGNAAAAAAVDLLS